ncbi:MAG: DUF1232 domain-containing protein [Anaerolineaceae bacterium]|nr:DUF1232 domain-containing protein [Anaerolineaceae bacterium]
MKRDEPRDRRSLLHHVLALGFGALALLHLVNPTAGLFELLPDNLPGVGNLDEGTATLLLTNVLAWYGFQPGYRGNTLGSSRRNLLSQLLALFAGALAALYLVNPTAGFLELLPDNLPLIGNLDEAGASLLLINVLAFYGIDLNRFGRRKRKNGGESHSGGALASGTDTPIRQDFP